MHANQAIKIYTLLKPEVLVQSVWVPELLSRLFLKAKMKLVAYLSF